jgi:hypothetical protein
LPEIDSSSYLRPLQNRLIVIILAAAAAAMATPVGHALFQYSRNVASPLQFQIFTDYLEDKRKWRRLKILRHNHFIRSNAYSRGVVSSCKAKIETLERSFAEKEQRFPSIFTAPEVVSRLLALVTEWRESDLLEYEAIMLRFRLEVEKIIGPKRLLDEMIAAKKTLVKPPSDRYTERILDLMQQESSRLGSNPELEKAWSEYKRQETIFQPLLERVGLLGLDYKFPDWPLLQYETSEQVPIDEELKLLGLK